MGQKNMWSMKAFDNVWHQGLYKRCQGIKFLRGSEIGSKNF